MHLIFRPTWRAILLAAPTLLLTACLGNGSGSNNAGNTIGTRALQVGESTPYRVELTRTSMGIPHVKADDFGSAGYGLGYAFAEDNLCVMMEDFITIRGERSRFFGENGSYTIEPNGSMGTNVNSDFFWKLIADDAAVDNLRGKILPEFQPVVVGYTDGFNRYLEELKNGRHPGRHLACADKEWLQTIRVDDLYRRFIRLSVLASSSVFVNEIGAAQPPANPTLVKAAPANRSVSTQAQIAALRNNSHPFKEMQERDRFGSNMYALDGSITDNGQSMVFGNPHFPWRGTERLYLMHIDIPGKMNIMGVALYGVPAVLIGFNEKLAWSHTVSTAFRFTPYELKIQGQDPTTYQYDGEQRKMTPVPLSIAVKQADGSLKTVKRTLYRSHLGPMITLSVSGVPVLGWNNRVAYTLRDANLENDRLINQFAKWNQAKSLDEFIDLHGSVLGVPWVNTVAAGPGQKPYYGDVTVVPNVSNAKVAACKAEPIHTVLNQVVPGLPVLDGSRSECNWDTDPDAPVPGIFGRKNLPTLRRDDWVHNCNDSYWLTNPAQPITGFARIIGDENTERTLRTRQCMTQVLDRLAGKDGLPGNKFNLKNLQDIVLSSQLHSEKLARAAVLSDLCSLPGVPTSNGAPVQTAEACEVLKNWDGRANLNSVGAHLWREFWRRAAANPAGLPIGLPPQLPAMWTTAFSASDPVNTPRGFNARNPQMALALGDAIAAVNASGLGLKRAFGDIQFSNEHRKVRIPVFGGTDPEGAFTIVKTDPLNRNGYGVTYGNSYIQTVTWTNDAKPLPIAEAMLTYSQSTDPASPHYQDYTLAYSKKQWLRLPFTDAEIAQQQISKTTLTR